MGHESPPVANIQPAARRSWRRAEALVTGRGFDDSQS